MSLSECEGSKVSNRIKDSSALITARMLTNTFQTKSNSVNETAVRAGPFLCSAKIL